MPHKIYGPPSHKLATVTITLHLPTRANSFTGVVRAEGRAQSKRDNLWSVSEEFTEAAQINGMSMTDAVHHLALIAVQDRPDTQDRFEYYLRGGQHYKTPPLPF